MKAGTKSAATAAPVPAISCYTHGSAGPGAPNALAVHGRGGPLLHGMEVLLSPSHPASHVSGAAGPQASFVQSCVRWLRAEAPLSQHQAHQ